MATVTMAGDEVAVHDLVGTGRFLAARTLVTRGQVREVQADPQDDGGEILHGTVEPGGLDVVTRVVRQPHGPLLEVHGSCPCTEPDPCPHSVALVLADLDGRTSAKPEKPAKPAKPAKRTPQRQAPANRRTGDRTARAADVPLEPAPPPAWAGVLSGLLSPAPATSARPGARRAGPPAATGPSVALQFELGTHDPVSVRRLARLAKAQGVQAAVPPVRVMVRPVRRSDAGNWVRSGITWHNLQHLQYLHRGARLTPRQTALLEEFSALQSLTERVVSFDSATDLAATSSRRVWDVLAEMRDEGVPLVWAGRGGEEVRLLTEPVRMDVDVRQASPDGDLLVRARLAAGGVEVPADGHILLGDPAHGMVWWPAGVLPGLGAPPASATLAPLAAPFTPLTGGLLAQGRFAVAAADADLFLADFYPRLREQVPVVSSDGSVTLPQAEPPRLRLTVTGDRRTPRVALEWSWVHRLGRAERTEPLAVTAEPDAARREQLDRVAALLAGRFPDLPDLFENPPPAPAGEAATPAAPSGPAPHAELAGVSAARFIAEVLPALDGVDTVVNLRTARKTPDYRSLDADPVISFTQSGEPAAPGEPVDWFDLAVTVTVDRRTVPFQDLFTALAQEQTHLLLPDGGYFSLDREQFRALARLIAESRALLDAPPATVRLTRFQIGAWADVERLGSVSGPAVATWRESVHALQRAADEGPGVQDVGAPPGLHAALRPYQRSGVNWLATLYRHGLGGVLADDMGLGKTLEVLALILHARRAAPDGPPFLVVAPTSVVANWAAEAARFAPDLVTATITQTAARRGNRLAEAVAGAGLVITSYTLLRIEYPEYERLPWSGLILDEAQAVKNHQSAGYRCVRDLAAPFKLAVTGTPIENNLMELWALMSVTAPGLFGTAARFAEHYRTGIERGRDPQLLAQLQRRLRPLMLRRTKDLVAADLPDKQEQVLELELSPRHRTVYDRYLHRERQKVLGLLGDLQRHRFEIFRSLTLLRQAALDPALVDPSHHGVGSAKLDTLLQQLQEITREGHRVLVFSQFTRFLALARHRIEAAGIPYCYLDGTTRNRPAVIDRFRSGAAPVFLISLKAGGTGLTLTEADYVVLLDPWWNPATEAQAVDRVHRIGQTRKVMVYRLVAKDTIEDKVMALKASKSALISSVLDAGDLASGALHADDIRALLS